MMRYGFGVMGLWMLIPLILLGIIIYAVIKLAGGSHNNRSFDYDRDKAINILDQRYANGEISDEEYRMKKEMLKNR